MCRGYPHVTWRRQKVPVALLAELPPNPNISNSITLKVDFPPPPDKMMRARPRSGGDYAVGITADAK